MVALGKLVPSVALMVVTNSPGDGKRTSEFSVVARLLTLARLATKSGGNLPSPDPPVSSTAAQFWYISRLPTLLNHVQERIAFPDFTPFGIGMSHSCMHSLCPGDVQAL
jgi:hypothetical protein